MQSLLIMSVRIGTAGWDYKDWYGTAYPKRRAKGFDPLRHLARYFDTVEVNNTFYRPVAEKVARQWIERVADAPSFRFTAKLWRRFTHERKEAFTADDVKQVEEGFRPLQASGRLGAVLVQFPWSFKNEEPSREWLGDVVRTFSWLPLVLEVRHLSWNAPDFYAWLVEQGVGFVNLDQPLFKNSIGPSARATSSVGYVRVHGRNYQDWFRKAAGRDERYDYLYTADELKPWAARVKTLAESPRTKEVFVITNNHFAGKAAANALMLASMLEGRRVDAPKELLETYPDALGPYAREG